MNQTVTAALAQHRRRATRFSERDRVLVALLIPAGIYLVAVAGIPILRTLASSLFSQTLIRPDAPATFVGLDNYLSLFQNAEFWDSVQTTVVWTILGVAGKAGIGLALALLFNNLRHGGRFYRILLLIPWATPTVVGAVVWRWFYSTETGYFNYLLVASGLVSGPINFFGSKLSAFLSVLAVDMWFGIPFMALVLYAGLQAIPQDVYEAAAVDGASALQRFRHVTIPLLVPVLGVATTLSTIWTFNSFNTIQVMTGGGPDNATAVLVIRTYRKAFEDYNVGQASAYAGIILVVLMVFTAIYWRILRKAGTIQ